MADAKTRVLKTHCKQGHEFTPDNVRIKNKGNGKYSRECRTCHNAKELIRKRKAGGAVDENGNRVRTKRTTNSILGSTAFGKDCLSRAQIMAFRDMK
jgi:nitrate/TMAO reductase-like tetraheme cytochrome c subunit